MKKLLLCTATVLLSKFAYCACPTITASIFHSGATENDYTLVIYLTKNVEDCHLQDVIYCDGVQFASGCNTFKENGTIYIQFNCTGAPTAKVNLYMKACGNNSTLCKTVNATVPVGGPLPVVLSAFSLQRNSNEVVINWQTEQEINSDRFEIERSFDNTIFETVGTVAAQGNSQLRNTYSYNVKTDTRKTSFFRVRLIDKDGSISFTPIKSVKGSVQKNEYSLYPNPVFGNAEITLDGLKEPAFVQVLDNSGRLVKSFSLAANNVISSDHLQKGIYIVRITGKLSNEVVVKKLTIIR